MEFFKSIGGFIMTPLYLAISAILLGWHKLWGGLFGDTTGVAWVLSIIGLTLVIRALLIPLFVKQIKSSRNMQLLQPKVKELREKYGHDRERFAQEQMKLFRETKTNPFSSCLPLIIQMPVFLALFRLIDQAAKDPTVERGLMTETLNRQFGDAVFLGAKISDTFLTTDNVGVRVLAAVLVLGMTATTFLTQRQLMSKNMPADALTGPYAQQQKLLLYVLPLVFAVGGIAFPIGVLFYWTTSNLWTMGQQFYVIRNNPAPNTEAFRAKQERDAEKRRRKGLADPEAPDAAASPTPLATEQTRTPPRQQPRNQTRSQRKKGGSKPGAPRVHPTTPDQGDNS
ncbi:membrane protein insertase YidC [Marmoricola sp. Leaf446]|uniref:membrane protein insertase YidC n=1 Tax=Marmoricola sp. Leaf446 TaxID=1736379 RepID=UPI000AC877B5|nr:membrane protein insertase YidC [Marmoricola sp. Leaf446]